MWTYFQPVRVIWGEGETKKLAGYLEQLGISRALLIADSFLEQNGTALQIQEYANGRIVRISSDVEPNPTVQNIESNLQVARELSVDGIVVLGGGSVMDCGKMTAAALAHGMSARGTLELPSITRALPVVAIPTTAGTGSEVTAGAVISDHERGTKIAVFSPAIFPKVALVDPVLTYTVPQKITVSTGLDVLAHALDAMSSVKANPATDALALRAAQLVVRYLERAALDGADKEARAGMSQASSIAGLAFSQTGTTGSHACSYILTSQYHMPHGEACAFTMDAWLVINAKARPVLEEYVRQLGFADAYVMADWINGVKKRFGMRCTLSQAGIQEEDLKEVVEAALASSNMANNVAQIGFEGVSTIYRSKK